MTLIAGRGRSRDERGDHDQRRIGEQAFLTARQSSRITAPAETKDPRRNDRWRVRKAWTDARGWLEGHLAWVVACWLLGVCLLSARLVVGWFAIERLKRVGTRPVDKDLRSRLDDLAGRLRISRPVRLLESALAELPAVIGCLKPIVLLPIQACTGSSGGAD